MQCSCVDAVFGCYCIVQISMQSSGVYAMQCNAMMQCWGFDAIFGCLCNVRIFMNCSGVDTMLGCLCLA